MLIRDIDAAKQLIEMQLRDIENIRTKAPYGLEYTFWEDFTAKIIDRIFGNDSSQRHGFEQAGRGGCFSVFESYSEHQRREDFNEILNCKKEYLENLIKELENHRAGTAGVHTSEADRHEWNYEDILRSSEASPLDRAIAQILSRIKNPGLFKEAQSNLLDLRDELYKPSPSWASLKKHLIWLIELGKEEFFSILPFVVLYVRKIMK
ncbi:MAG: hypothetical protein HPY89_12415 [Pelotomaculum sp.]|uniref:Uncharacterized protein n=1 Tax=Pelotomaculum thermopropionicum (strain DSM 13744 / JCM 10971 / SI) TaxID=370438 RepID=A5D2N4_PELTS|nr:hypothetical protein [Pelotomaculum sp.]BAF59518.1 hypothetical protein PTH_1337 [Pelotomaculum thermopropionicum SI]